MTETARPGCSRYPWFPWQAKIAAKVVLARLPVPYDFWRKVGIFKWGEMTDPEYASAVFELHLERARPLEPGFTALEIGPGDSLLGALCAHGAGAGSTYLVDVGSYATTDIHPYLSMADRQREQGLLAPDLTEASSIDDVLAGTHASYLQDGVASVRTIDTASVDFSWSFTVLEHVARDDVGPLLAQLARVHKPGTISSHTVDLRDHLDESLNNLRFSDRRWERPLVHKSGFYTNRLRFSEWMEHFDRAGFDADVVDRQLWRELPTPRERLDAKFQKWDDDELRVAVFDVVLRRRVDGA